MEDWLLMALIAAGVATLTSIAWIAYNTQRFHEQARRHAERIEKINHDYAMHRRTYGAVPIEALVGHEDPTTGGDQWT